MKQHFIVDPWSIIEKGFDPNYQRQAESIYSLGNGRMGQRANFEERYSGKSLQGSYIAGVYFPDKTKVGWWKNGYPEYFAKVLNSCNWIGINISVDDEELDLAKANTADFHRELDMQNGLLKRRFTAELPSGRILRIDAERFLSLKRDEVGAIRYSVTPVNFSGRITFEPYLDFDVKNADSNYDEKFWAEVTRKVVPGEGFVQAQTKKLNFHVGVAMRWLLSGSQNESAVEVTSSERYSYVANRIVAPAEQGKAVTLYKYAAVVSSLNAEVTQIAQRAKATCAAAAEAGYEVLKAEHQDMHREKWTECDIIIDGDEAAQQGIRFNIFQLNQTFTGVDERLNIGPKGFTGEKYGGSTYWDTEAYCLPFYLATAPREVARNLLRYRHKHLAKAIENARKLGFSKGAALYPMVTMNGEECHNEWEITFEEIHRNGAIAYAIYNYVRHTQDYDYLLPEGWEVLLGISRFWAQRFNWSEEKQAYVMLGVTGPNEYENNVNNNWYTNYIACWTLRYTQEVYNYLKKHRAVDLDAWEKAHPLQKGELQFWKELVNKCYYPKDTNRDVFLQQDGFLDKVIAPVSQLDPAERPINQHWSWDRILRSCYIKQADVLQGLYFFEHEFDRDTIRRNFDFYEPLTVHESSLSPCVHVVLAARLGYDEKAYELYLRTSRLDLDDYNKEVHEGLHITSMAGTWMSVVQGFGGMRIVDNELHFEPRLPSQWKRLQFRLSWRGSVLNVVISPQSTQIQHAGGDKVSLIVHGKKHLVSSGEAVEI